MIQSIYYFRGLFIREKEREGETQFNYPVVWAAFNFIYTYRFRDITYRSTLCYYTKLNIDIQKRKVSCFYSQFLQQQKLI